MFKELLANFKHYYDARGREEIKSFALTILAGFAIGFGAFALPVLQEVAYGQTQLSEVVTLGAIATAAVRSLAGGLLYAIWPDKFKFRVTGEK